MSAADVPGKVMSTAYTTLMSNFKRNTTLQVHSETELHRLSNIDVHTVERRTSPLPTL